MTTALYSAQCL